MHIVSNDLVLSISKLPIYTFINYIFSYSHVCRMDYGAKVLETRKIQVAGGVKLGGDNPTWLKQPGDKLIAYFGAAIGAFGCFNIGIGTYYLSTGKGQIE
jgi:hypothetical protein